MVLNYQRWTPPCGCSFEQEVDSDTGEIKLLFTHILCAAHEDIAINTPQVRTQAAKDTEINKIIAKKDKAWKDNSDKNLADFDDKPEVKHIKNKVKGKDLDNLAIEDPNTKLLFDYYQEQRSTIQGQVDKFTKDKKIEMLLGLQYEHSLNGKNVYDKIIKDMKEEAIKNGE